MESNYTSVIDLLDIVKNPDNIKSQYLSGITMLLYSKAESVCLWAGGDISVQNAKFPSWVDLLLTVDMSQEEQQKIWADLQQKAETCYTGFQSKKIVIEENRAVKDTAWKPSQGYPINSDIQ